MFRIHGVGEYVYLKKNKLYYHNIKAKNVPTYFMPHHHNRATRFMPSKTRVSRLGYTVFTVTRGRLIIEFRQYKTS
jgi:hypothetical protein